MTQKVVPLAPTEEMLEAGAQRLVRWETGQEKWPDSWTALDVRASRHDAERCWRSMYLAAPSRPTKEENSAPIGGLTLEDMGAYQHDLPATRESTKEKP